MVLALAAPDRFALQFETGFGTPHLKDSRLCAQDPALDFGRSNRLGRIKSRCKSGSFYCSRSIQTQLALPPLRALNRDCAGAVLIVRVQAKLNRCYRRCTRSIPIARPQFPLFTLKPNSAGATAVARAQSRLHGCSSHCSRSSQTPPVLPPLHALNRDCTAAIPIVRAQSKLRSRNHHCARSSQIERVQPWQTEANGPLNH